jgi:cell shape-determining protein MreD
MTAFIAGNSVFCCFKSAFTKKINKITHKSDKNTNVFVILLVFLCDFIDFVCEFIVKTTEQTVASYKSSDFT